MTALHVTYQGRAPRTVPPMARWTPGTEIPPHLTTDPEGESREDSR